MPIAAENRRHYRGPGWKATRTAILARAGDCCERCKAPNRKQIARGSGRDAGTYMVCDGGAVHDDTTGAAMGWAKGSEYTCEKWPEVVLTIAHLNHVAGDDRHENLQALCQQCHNRLDLVHRQANARRTRRRRHGQQELGLGER